MGELRYHAVCRDCTAEYVGTDRGASWAFFETHSDQGHAVELLRVDGN